MNQTTQNKGSRIGPFLFSPRWFTSICALLVFTILVNLGLWQLRRSEVKQLEIDEIEQFKAQLAQQNPTFQDYLTHYEQYQFALNESPIALAGKYIPNKQTVLLDNRVHARQVGYHAINLFKPDNSDWHILINRGWIPLPQQRRDIVPTIDLPSGHFQLSGKLWVPNPDILTLTEDIFLQKEDTIFAQKLDLTLLAEQLGVQLAPFVMKLQSDQPHGFVRDWIPVTEIGTSPEKHVSYAVQWFGMSLALFIIYIVTNTSRIDSQRRQPKS